MKKYVVLLLIVVSIILSLSITVHAAYTEPLPDNTYDLPYMIIMCRGVGEHSSEEEYILVYSSKPLVVYTLDFWGDGTGYWGLEGMVGEGERYTAHHYVYRHGIGWYEWNYGQSYDIVSKWIVTEIVYANYSVGLATTTFELEENQTSFFGIDFEYSWFLGDLKLQIGKKEEETGQYKIIKEWIYPRGSGNVSIPENEIPQGNKGEYIIYIYEGDTIIQQYPYTLNVKEKESYCEINYPVNGQTYNYYPNVNIRYYDMGRLYIYINGEMYKQIQTANKEGIELIDGQNELFEIGLNDVTVKDSNGQVVATVQYEVLREGLDSDYELPEFEAESWVQELFSRIMNEYSLFFEYVKSMYAYLPMEIIGLVGIIMTLSVILWFTGRK